MNDAHPAKKGTVTKKAPLGPFAQTFLQHKSKDNEEWTSPAPMSPPPRCVQEPYQSHLVSSPPFIALNEDCPTSTPERFAMPQWCTADGCVALARQLGWQDSPEDMKAARRPFDIMEEDELMDIASGACETSSSTGQCPSVQEPVVQPTKPKRDDVVNPLGRLLS